MKIKRISGRLAALLLLVLLLALETLPAYAADEWIDLDAKGSITLTLRDEKKQAVGGGEVAIYQVATVAVDDGNLSFQYTNGFENCGIKLGDLNDSSLAGKLQAKLSKTASYVAKTVGKDGKVTFSDLHLGLYLVVQTKPATGYNAVSSFLVSVPMQENGTYIYSVDASPKMELAKKVNTPDKPKAETPKPPKTGTLPQTGQLDWPIPILAVAGLLLFALGWQLRKNFNDSIDEEPMKG